MWDVFLCHTLRSLQSVWLMYIACLCRNIPLAFDVVTRLAACCGQQPIDRCRYPEPPRPPDPASYSGYVSRISESCTSPICSSWWKRPCTGRERSSGSTTGGTQRTSQAKRECLSTLSARVRACNMPSTPDSTSTQYLIKWNTKLFIVAREKFGFGLHLGGILLPRQSLHQ